MYKLQTIIGTFFFDNNYNVISIIPINTQLTLTGLFKQWTIEDVQLYIITGHKFERVS